MIDTEVIRLDVPEGANLILGHSHFIKTVEDLYDILAAGSMGILFGIAFCEASQDRLVRHTGNDAELEEIAVANLHKVGAGHAFLIYIRNAFPIHVLPAIKACPEVVRVYCATANPVEVIVASTEQGRGILGVIDGEPPLGIEDADARAKRREFLRTIQYKES